jgi:hypothetical protein
MDLSSPRSPARKPRFKRAIGNGKGSIPWRVAANRKSYQRGHTPNREFEGLVDGSSERVMVVMGAYVHKEPIVSSPIEKRYPVGTELEVIARSDGWAHIRNPISKHTGWVLERHYLAPAKSSPASQVAKVEAETSSAEQASPPTKARRKTTAQYKRKAPPRSRELADSNFSFSGGPGRPRWTSQWENRRQARRNWRQITATCGCPTSWAGHLLAFPNRLSAPSLH